MISSHRLLEIKELADKHYIAHRFICNDPIQEDQVNYWNATMPPTIIEMIEELLASREVVGFYAAKDNWLPPIRGGAPGSPLKKPCYVDNGKMAKKHLSKFSGVE